MLQTFEKRPEHLAAVERLKVWTRVRFELAEETTIFVSEVSCTLPGCPPRETVVAFWTKDTRHQFKVFKPVAQVVLDDLPPAWLKPALVVAENAGWECC